MICGSPSRMVHEIKAVVNCKMFVPFGSYFAVRFPAIGDYRGPRQYVFFLIIGRRVSDLQSGTVTRKPSFSAGLYPLKSQSLNIMFPFIKDELVNLHHVPWASDLSRISKKIVLANIPQVFQLVRA